MEKFPYTEISYIKICVCSNIFFLMDIKFQTIVDGDLRFEVSNL